MPDLRNQLREYVEETIERIDVADVSAVIAGRSQGQSLVRRPAFVFAMAAVAFLVAVGGAAWLVRGAGSIPADEPPATSMATPTPTTSDIRPPVEVPYIAVEGGTDILATTTAKPTPPVATCPADSRPDEPGPADQDRPQEVSPTAFDRQSGKVVVHLGGATWSFDVCSNRWTRMSNSGLPDGNALVYDADSDLLVEIDGELAYDFDTDTWTHLSGESGKFLTALYDPVTGLIVARDLGTAVMWAYDVDTETWTEIDQGSIAPAPFSGGAAVRESMVYDPDTDRIVLWYGDHQIGGPLWGSGGIEATWTFDPRAGVWTVEPTATPDLGWVDAAVYDESAHLSVFFGTSAIAGYDAATHEWRILSEIRSGGFRTASWGVYDPVNDRVLGGGGDSKDVWGFYSKTGEWIELLPPPE